MTNALQLFSVVFGLLSIAVRLSQAAISILDPNSSVTWYTNNTVTVKWSSAANDPSPFRILLNNPNQSLLNGNASIADSVPTANEQVTILLPLLNDGNGYILYFINPNATSQVYAMSQPFAIATGNVTTSSAAMGSATGTITTNTYLPGPVATFPTSAQTTASASASASASATHASSATTRFAVDVGVAPKVVVVLLLVGLMSVATL